MASSFKDFILGEQVTFFIGAEKRPIAVHAAAIAATGKHFHRLINDCAKEASTVITIENLKVDDFVRFCEYAYRGDYTVPLHETDPESEEPQQNGVDTWDATVPEARKKKAAQLRDDDEPAQPDLRAAEAAPEENIPQPIEDDGEWVGWGLTSTKTGKKKKKKGGKIDGDPTEPAVAGDVPEEKDFSVWLPAEPPIAEPEPLVSKPTIKASASSRATLHANFQQRMRKTRYEPKLLVLQSFEPKPNSTANQNFTPVLLAHARLYSFAHVRLIEPLKALALDKLHETLLNFKLYKQRIPDIVALARFVYNAPELPGRGDDGILDEMRQLVLQYIICEIDTIGGHEAFFALMEEGGEFVGDFWRMTRSYVA